MLRAIGIGRQDRIAVIHPNGPELAVAIVAVASNAACVVLNPANAPEELERYLAAVRPRALITPAGLDSPARPVAQSRGITVVELAMTDREAGLFALSAEAPGEPSREPVGPGDVAVLLLTSGTTSRPKIVPLTHANICTSAFSSAAALALSEADRCLNILPLFHGHGLIATVLASLAAGASVVCTPGCDVNSFFGWLTTFRPTWYSAVPTMHQAILAQARQEREQLGDCQLRLVRSASASLPPHVFAELERTFGTCVIEFYGMTETASAPIACNPMPPRRRKAGSVGVPLGLNVAIMDKSGVALPRGETGEVAVRGVSVMRGYYDDPAATRAAFAGEWFKTGDHGFFDADGYLFLSGRTREMINRGGENIAPREVDEALLEHPAIAEAVTFAVPHTTLGEDVAAAVVLRPNAELTTKDIRQFAGERLADFKVPRQVIIVKELPKGPTGKVQRVGLAAKFGLIGDTATPRSFVAPRTPLEKALARVWAEVLQLEQVGLHDNFFALGGDSLLATRILIRVYEITQFEVEVSYIFEAPTVAEMAEHIETLIAASPAPSVIVRVPRQNGAAPSSFGQERLWNLQHALPDLPFFNVLYALRVTWPCDVPVLERSINEIVDRHEILRTTFATVGGRCVQVIAPQLIAPLAFDDLRAMPRSKMETTVRKRVQEELSHSFVLEHGPLIRTRLVSLAERSHLLLIAMSGIIEDGWSLGVLTNELADLYCAVAARKAPPLAPLPIQYADFADWQRRWQSYPDVVAQLKYWEEQLRDPLPAINLSRGRQKPKIEDFATAQRQVALPPELSEAVKDFSQREGVTLFVALVAALKTLLHRYTGINDIRVATDVANRNRPGTEGLIGPVANTVILRTSLRGEPNAREVIRRVRATILGALANQDIPFEAVFEVLERDRAVNPADIAQVKISLQTSSLRPAASSDPGLAFEEVDPGMLLPLVTMTTFDVTLMLRDSNKGLVGTCMYKPHLFDTDAVDRLLRDFRQVLEHMVMHPERPISVISVSSNQRN